MLGSLRGAKGREALLASPTLFKLCIVGSLQQLINRRGSDDVAPERRTEGKGKIGLSIEKGLLVFDMILLGAEDADLLYVWKVSIF